MPKTPKYRLIAGSYRDRILTGELPSGAKLPSRREMMDLHKVSRATADEVMKTLQQESMVISSPRSGMVVADVSDRVPTAQERVRASKATGRVLGANESGKILSAQIIPCPADVALRLGVEEGDDVVARERVTFRNDKPLAVSISYYPKEAADLTPELASLERIQKGARELAVERMGSPQHEEVTYVVPRYSTEREMELLEIGDEGPSGDRRPVPVLEATRVVTLEDGRVVEVAKKVSGMGRPATFRVLLNQE